MGYTDNLVGRGNIKTKIVGKVYKEQLYIIDSRKWMLQRISPICENCNDNKYYNIICTSKTYIFIFVLPIFDRTYEIVCPKCGENIELEFKEYRIIEPFIKLNRKYEQGRIDQLKYSYKILKISEKYKKKYS